MWPMFEPLRKYAQFNGRARRAEYWQFTLLVVVIAIVAAIAAGSVFHGLSPDDLQAIVYAIVLVPFGIPSLAVSVRRLHDIDRSGWWMLVGLLPFVGGVAGFVAGIIDGTPGPNKYGPDPKGRGVAEVFA